MTAIPTVPHLADTRWDCEAVSACHWVGSALPDWYILVYTGIYFSHSFWSLSISVRRLHTLQLPLARSRLSLHMVFSPLHCWLVWATVCRLKFDAIPHLYFCCFLSFWFHIKNSSSNNKNPCPSQWLCSFRSFDLICGVCLERREQSYPCTQMLFSSVILWRGCPSYL